MMPFTRPDPVFFFFRFFFRFFVRFLFFFLYDVAVVDAIIYVRLITIATTIIDAYARFTDHSDSDLRDACHEYK